jgi:chromate reductase
MKIIAIAGALRKESYNKALAKAAGEVVFALDPHVEFEILDFSDVPLFDQDIEHPSPAAVARVRKIILEASGIWIFTPEYNHSYPGVLKNLIDWLSRPFDEGQPQVLAGKPVAFSGASIGAGGSSIAQEHLISLLSYVEMPILNSPRLTIANVQNQLSNGTLELTTSAPYLKRQAQAFIAFIKEQESF